MHMERKPLAELIPAPYNPRVELHPGDPRYRKLRHSLQQFGLVEPLIWNQRTNHVVGGHQRLKILRELGVTEVDVSVVDLDEEREKALNIVLNNREAQSDFDITRLTELLGDLQSTGGLKATGFDPSHLEILRRELTPVAMPPLDLPGGTGIPACPLEESYLEITIRIPTDKVAAIRPQLDKLIAEHGLEVHVRQC